VSNDIAAYSIVCTEDGSVAKDKASSSKMLKDARDLANCAYEDNSLWGKEASPTSSVNSSSYKLTRYQDIKCFNSNVSIAGWHDLWLCRGRYIDRLCYTVQRMEIYLLHSKAKSIFGVRSK
jgi:hypothetical protein